MKYTITTGNNKCIKRNAYTAVDAIEKLCDQYNWSYKLKLVDADTCGEQWAECLVDRNGGINYGERVVAVITQL